MNTINTFGNRLKELRNIKGLSQRELAKQLNVAPSTLAMYELDKREPDYDTLKRIADYFEVSLDYLLGRVNNPNPLNKIAEEELDYSSSNLKELPEEAQKTLKEFINYMQSKYNNKKKKP